MISLETNFSAVRKELTQISSAYRKNIFCLMAFMGFYLATFFMSQHYDFVWLKVGVFLATIPVVVCIFFMGGVNKKIDAMKNIDGSSLRLTGDEVTAMILNKGSGVSILRHNVSDVTKVSSRVNKIGLADLSLEIRDGSKYLLKCCSPEDSMAFEEALMSKVSDISGIRKVE